MTGVQTCALPIWGYLYSALEVDGENAAEFLCLPRVDLEMSRMFLEHVAACDPQAEHVVIQDQAGFHLNPELHELPPRVHVIPLPPYSPELNPVEAIGDVIKDRIGKYSASSRCSSGTSSVSAMVSVVRASR